MLSFFSKEPHSPARLTEPQKFTRMSLYIWITQLGLKERGWMSSNDGSYSECCIPGIDLCYGRHISKQDFSLF